ncbi:hypothetical protein TNIN_136491 [Trichonephila inaurata madagascariensis]|uniref:Uncharacterized protein n=1 Tax=Trichonephila inaurata madagascariensis TaxID=2747483 RepID=A0A8X6YNT6_9ARAC|nr:hypothetical protein TNIN_136491 [Trichonephila inaurata madagascariensis]
MISSSKTRTCLETIRARNIYAAWARKLTTARPNDPDLQNYHEEIRKSNEIVSAFLTQLNVPLFKIPATEKELDLIVLRTRSKVDDPQPSSAEEAKKPAAVLPSPRKGRKAKRSVDADGFAPKQLVRKVRSPRSCFFRFGLLDTLEYRRVFSTLCISPSTARIFQTLVVPIALLRAERIGRQPFSHLSLFLQHLNYFIFDNLTTTWKWKRTTI